MRALTILLIAITAFVAADLSRVEQVPGPEAPQVPEDPTNYYIDLGLKIGSLVLGLLWVFLGYRLIKVVLFLGGFVLFFFILLIVLNSHATSLAQWLRYVIAAGAGLIGGFLFVVLRKVGYFLFGFLLGAVIGAIVLAALSGPLSGVFTSALVPLIIILVCGLVVAIATVFLSRHLLIFATSINGAYLVGVTVDGLAGLNTSVSTLVTHIITNFNEKFSFGTSWQPFAVLGGIAVLAIIGIVVQYKFTAKGHDADKPKQSEEEYLLTAPYA